MEEYFGPSMALELQILLDVCIAIILTGIIGSEREMSDKPAGFRTNMIVGASAALIVSIGRILVEEWEDHSLMGNLRYDPLRMIEAIVVGVSFIGGGTILKSEKEEKVRYLTSAATLLLSAGVGIAVASHKYLMAAGLTLIVFTINQIIGKVERHFDKSDKND